MPSRTARRLCPSAIFVRPRMSLYAEESERLGAIFRRYTPMVEPLSLDEAFLDVGGSEKLFGTALDIAHAIRSEIREARGLVASVGVAPNKFVAKVASDLDKPDGLVAVAPDEIERFLEPLPVGYLWGVGRSTSAVFERMGVVTIGQLRDVSTERMDAVFGRQGEHLTRLARGIDSRPVVPEREAKSLSHERTFTEDIRSVALLRGHLHALADQVGARLRRRARQGRRVQIKLRFADFHTISRAVTLPQPTDLSRDIRSAAGRLLMDNLGGAISSARSEPAGDLLARPVRLLGVGVAGFSAATQRQPDLFAEPERARAAQLDRIMDEVRERYGSRSLRRGGDAG